MRSTKIDRVVFAREMALLQDRCNRTLGKPTLQRYHQTLSAALTTEQFEKAARVLFDEATFFPSPKEFVDAALGDVKEQSSIAWAEIVQAARDARKPDVDDTAREALRAIGGHQIIMTTDEQYGLPRLRNLFRDHYESAKREARRTAIAALGEGEQGE